MPRQGVGHVRGFGGVLGGPGQPFYEVRLLVPAVSQLEQLVTVEAGGRGGVIITSDFYDADRLRVMRVGPPAYEAGAARHYLRDSLRVRGRTGNSCNIDLSARSGVPELVRELQSARAAAASFVMIRVPNRSRDLVEIIPDVELASDGEEFGQAGAALAAQTLAAEDFSDWETAQPADEHGH